ncbi:MAG: phosphoglucosamine mutase [Actinobacteria bacterium]|nr:phosphoglucosamine mutase [Actinomycetota bacterium]
MARLFGTDGIRGVANEPPMTPETALAAGRAVVEFYRDKDAACPRVVVGRDTRLSGLMLESALAAGVCSAGGRVLKAGVLPTPGVAFAVRDVGARAGVVISASHNPFRDNGIKIFSGDGFKLSDPEEDRLELLMTATPAKEQPLGAGIGTVEDFSPAADRYVSFCCGTFPGRDLDGLKLVLDCANGATSLVAPQVFSALGAQVTSINNEPTGININEDCGSEHPDSLKTKVLELGADAGLAFDGDGDRVIAVDEKGVSLTGDQLLAISARMYRDRGWLERDLVVSTVMSNLGLERALRALGVSQVTSQVGDRQVIKLMEETGAVLGGEESGHIVFRRYHTTGDGIIAGLQVLGAMRFYNTPLSALATLMTVMPQITMNIDVSSKPPLDQIDGLQQAVKEAESLLGDAGRVLIRYSGTQSMCRVMVEGLESDVIRRQAGILAEIIRLRIGAN